VIPYDKWSHERIRGIALYNQRYFTLGLFKIHLLQPSAVTVPSAGMKADDGSKLAEISRQIAKIVH